MHYTALDSAIITQYNQISAVPVVRYIVCERALSTTCTTMFTLASSTSVSSKSRLITVIQTNICTQVAGGSFQRGTDNWQQRMLDTKLVSHCLNSAAVSSRVITNVTRFQSAKFLFYYSRHFARNAKLLSNTGHCHVMVIKLSYTVKFWQQSAIVLQAASWIPQPQPEIFFINPVRISEVVGIPSPTDAVFMLGENCMVHFEPY